MVRLVWRTDVHLSDTPPASRKDDWAATIFNKLHQVARLAEHVKASAILDGGDFFHVKSPGRNTHDLVRRVAEFHAASPCPVYANVGNHDCVYGDYEYLDQQPLGVLFAAGVFRRCYDGHEAVFEQGGTKVRVVGVPYHGTKYDMTRFRSIQKKDEDFLVCIAHVLASPTGGTMFEGEDIIRYSELAELAPDVFCVGHWHQDQGVADLGRVKVINIGSLTRGSLSQDELLRKPACAVLEFRKGEPPRIQVVRLKVGLPEDVFDVAGRLRADARTTTVSAFVDALRQKLVVDRTRTVEDAVRDLTDVPDTVRERVLLYLERAASA